MALRLVPEDVQPLIAEFDLAVVPSPARGVLNEGVVRALGDQYLRALQAVREAQAHLDAEYAALVQSVAATKERRTATLALSESWVIEQLKLVFAALPLPPGKSKSHAFLMGRIGRREKPGRWVVTEAEVFLAWVNADDTRQAMRRVSQTPDVRELNLYGHTTGDTPPGTTYLEHETHFYAAPVTPEPLTIPVVRPILTASPHTSEES
jgi:hypothetical protein